MFIKLFRLLIYEKCNTGAKSLSDLFLLLFEYIRSMCNFKQHTVTGSNEKTTTLVSLLLSYSKLIPLMFGLLKK